MPTSAPRPLRVVIVEDQRLVREGLVELLRHDFEVVGQAGNGREGLALCRTHRPDVALMDVVMPVMDGIACTRALAAESPTTRVLALTTYDADDKVFAMLEAGASGYVLKDIEPAELAHAIRVVHDGQSLLAPSVLRRIVERFGRPRRILPVGPGALTPRELEVLQMIARGLSNEEIAAAAQVSMSTVKTHVGRLLEKLECRDRAQLVICAYECGLVRPGG